MNIEKNEMLFIYDSNDLQEREALGYAETLKDIVVKKHDVNFDKFTARQLAQLADTMGVNPKELVSADDQPNLSTTDILKMLEQNPKKIKTPIAIYNDRADFVKSPYNFVNKNLEIDSGTSGNN